MPFLFRALALAAAAFSLVALAGCDAQRISELQPGISTEADVRDRFGVPETIWDEAAVLAMNRTRGTESLWGFCATCVFAEVCLGGCTFTAHAILGRPGNNPYCHFRARTMAARGKRERLVLIQAAEGRPFDNGLFELIEEDLDAPEPAPPPGPKDRLLQIRRPAGAVG